MQRKGPPWRGGRPGGIEIWAILGTVTRRWVGRLCIDTSRFESTFQAVDQSWNNIMQWGLQAHGMLYLLSQCNQIDVLASLMFMNNVVMLDEADWCLPSTIEWHKLVLVTVSNAHIL